MKEWGALFAAIIGLTPVFLAWIKGRSAESANRRKIQHAKEKVEFLQVWLQAQIEVSSDERIVELKSDVAQRLDNLLMAENELRDRSAQSTDTSAPSEDTRTRFQKIILAYKPHTTAGWIYHSMFYIAVAFLSLGIVGLGIDTTTGMLSWEAYKKELFNEDFFYFVLGMGILSIPVIMIQIIANHTEKLYLKDPH